MNSLRLWPSLVLVLFATFFFAAVSRTSSSLAAAPATAAAGDDEDGADRGDDEQTEEKPAAPPASPDEQAALTPQRGFSVRKEDAKIIDAFEDFRRHSQKKAWELAFKAVASITEKDPKGMVPAGDGLMMPTRQRVWQALASLPPDGREAYRLFNDANAKQRFDAATSGASDDVPALREIFQLYFVTSIGDKAADRLGDGCFEAGDFLAADAAWKAILDHYPDTSLSKTRLRVKRCAALSRAARWDTFDEVAASLGADGAAETVRLAGREALAGQLVASFREAARGTAGDRSEPVAQPQAASEPAEALGLPEADKPLWQVKFMDETLAEKLEQALRNMGWGGTETPMSASVPPSATDGKRVYLNWLGIAFAIDAKTGKMLWRSRKFSDLSNQAQQLVYGGVNIIRYHLVLDGDRVLITGMPIDQMNQGMGSPYRLVCHNAENGSVLWSTKTGDVAAYSIASAPLPVGDVIYVAASRTNQQELHLLALSGEKGKLLWSVPLGTPQASVDYRGMQQGPSPLLLHRGGEIYVVTNNGAVLAVDTSGRRVDWAFTCEPPPIMSGYVMFFNPSMSGRAPLKTPGAAFIRDSVLYFKESGGYAIYALDLAGPSLKWKRAADSSDMIAGVGSGSVYLVGDEVSAIDLSTRAMRWSTSLPIETGMLRPILGGDRLYVFSGRGVFQVDTTTGDPAARPFRGADLESLGGALFRCGDRLVAVSNLAVTAYPLSPSIPHPSSTQH
jgi:outer membrane protein assembly factor BamB